MSSFITELRKLAPDPEKLFKYGLPADYIDQYLKSFICTPKVKRTQVGYFNNELLTIMSTYDCSNVEIGIIRLNKDVIEHDDFYEVGLVDLDILALNKDKLDITVRDHDEENYTLWRCASNSVNFLEALLFCAEIFVRKVTNPDLEYTENEVSKIVALAADKAGGEGYAEFYKILFS